MTLCGRQYLIDHCFLVEEEYQKELAYKSYVSDTLMNINNSTVNAFGGKMITTRYIDLIEFSNKDHKEQDSEEIIERISNKLDKLGND